jgi:hypothetical protein
MEGTFAPVMAQKITGFGLTAAKTILETMSASA